LAYKALNHIVHFPDLKKKRLDKLQIGPDDGRVLELGCGTGVSSKIFADAFHHVSTGRSALLVPLSTTDSVEDTLLIKGGRNEKNNKKFNLYYRIIFSAGAVCRCRVRVC
jgi:protein-L-isoaspartate O-methyltransferase